MSLTKTQKIEKLKALGVELNGTELVAELDSLLEKFNPTPEKANSMPEADAATGVTNAREEANGSQTVMTVRYINPELGLTDRVFSLADHGEDFIALAKQFATKYDGTIDPA